MNRLAELKALADKPTEKTWLADLDLHAKGVAEAMTGIHGGRWRVLVSHENCLVMIAREFEGWRRGKT